MYQWWLILRTDDRGLYGRDPIGPLLMLASGSKWERCNEQEQEGSSGCHFLGVISSRSTSEVERPISSIWWGGRFRVWVESVESGSVCLACFGQQRSRRRLLSPGCAGFPAVTSGPVRRAFPLPTMPSCASATRL
jgi:hypothetical protein